MRLFSTLSWRAAKDEAKPVRDDQDAMSEEEKEAIFQRLLLGRWCRSATPTLEEMDHLRWVLPKLLTMDGVPGLEPEMASDLVAALTTGGSVAACLRQHGYAVGDGSNDVAMSLAWMACGEEDGLARLWLVDALTERLGEVAEEEATALVPVIRTHLLKVGFGGGGHSEDGLRSLVGDLFLGGVDADLRRGADRDRFVEAHLDGLMALRAESGWRERHAQAIRPLLGVEVRHQLRAVAPPADDDFVFDIPEPDPVPEPPVEAVEVTGDAPPVLRVTSKAFSAAEKHLKRYAALEKPLPLQSGRDLGTLEDDLLAEFPWLEDPIRRIAHSQLLRSRGQKPWFSLRPILLVGPQGAGKTRFVRRLSERAGLPLSRFNAAGRSGAVEILGHSSAYREAHPSAPVTAIAEHEIANPMILIDEMEKFGSSDYNGDPRHALIPMLEAETARAFPDDYVRTCVDISHVSFLFTANSLDGLSGPLLDRIDIFEVKQPTAEHFDGILAGLLREVADDAGLLPEEMPRLAPQAVTALRRAFTGGTSIRRLKKAVSAAVESATGYDAH